MYVGAKPISANVRIYARAVPFGIIPYRWVMPAHSGKLSPGQSSLLPLHSARHAAGVRVKPHRSAARRARNAYATCVVAPQSFSADDTGNLALPNLVNAFAVTYHL